MGRLERWWKTTLAEGQVSHMGEDWRKYACRLMEK